MRIIFHLGTYKTGTTSFQDALFNNRDLLLEHGILHPNTGLANEKNLGHRHTLLIRNFALGKDDACPNALLDELNASNARTAIISSEAWSNPGSLSHLTRLVTVLEENGYNDCAGFLSLRNLAEYQVSHYREFTVNRSNGQNYQNYIQGRAGMFDYLFLVRSFRSIFGSRFFALPFDASSDMTADLFKAMGFESLCKQMKQVDRANVRSATPLEVEAMRCANLKKRPQTDGLSALSSIIAVNSDIATENWTERFIGDTPAFTSTYRRNLQNAANWSESDIEALLHQDEPQGRNVREVRKLIIDELQNG